GMLEIDEVVVVALEDVAITVHPDDAVQDDRVEHVAVVGDDLADAVGALAAHHGEVAGVELGLHRHAVRDDVAGGSSEGGRREKDPRRREDDHAEDSGEELPGVTRSHRGNGKRSGHPGRSAISRYVWGYSIVTVPVLTAATESFRPSPSGTGVLN